MNLSCLLCYQASPSPVCQWCEQDIFFFDNQNYNQNLLTFGPVGRHVRHAHIDSLSLLGLHTWPLSRLVHQFKFQHSLTAGKVLSTWFVDKKQHHKATPPQLLIPVPITSKRIASRHYNQAAVLAKAMGNAWHICCDNRWALRRGSTTQHHLSKTERVHNAKAVFALSKQCLDGYIARWGEKISVAIVDDVVTTGVTADVLGALLKARYPSIKVEVWAMTFTPPPKSSLFNE